MVHSKDQEVLIDNDDDKERLLDTFNELLFQHIKAKKDKKKALETLDEIQHEIRVLKATLKENKSLINNDQNGLINKCEVIQKS